MRVTESCYSQLSVFGVAQSAKCVKSAEDVLRKTLGALVRHPSTFTALGQSRSYFETGAVLQKTLAGLFQLRNWWFAKGTFATAARAIVTSVRAVVSAFLFLTRLLIIASYIIALRSLWSPTTFPRFLVTSCTILLYLALSKKLKLFCYDLYVISASQC